MITACYVAVYTDY